MADKLVVTGLGKPLDGGYDFDLVGLLTLGHPECLTNREGHRMKQMTGLRMGEFTDAARKGDNDVLVAIAAIVLSRNGRVFEEDLLWDAPMGSGISIEPDTAAAEADAVPLERPQSDEQPKQSGGEQRSPIEPQTGNGGGSLSQSSDGPSGSDPSPIGRRLSVTPMGDQVSE